MKVHWTETALRHLSAIHDYVALDSLVYARDLVDQLTSRSKQIGSGRMVPEYEADDVREVIEGSYRIIYRILTDRVDVVAVIHGARELPPT
ncbi:MAG: type II toxin-antitoxin system RelE/ParE family toxin [Gemmatimonadota bacterium]